MIRRLLAKLKRQPAYPLDRPANEPQTLQLRTSSEQVLCDPLLSSSPNPKRGRLFKL